LPLAPRAVLALATIQLEHNEPDQALATLNEVESRFPRSPLVPTLLFRSAEALQKLKRTDEARRTYLKVAEIDPRDPWADDAVLRAAQIALEAGDPGAAGEIADSFTARFPESKLEPEVRLIRARVLTAKDRPKEAITLLEPLVGIKDGREAP